MNQIKANNDKLLNSTKILSRIQSSAAYLFS